jgi:hypothetical protein
MDAFEFVTNEKEQFSSEDPKLPDRRLLSAIHSFQTHSVNILCLVDVILLLQRY